MRRIFLPLFTFILFSLSSPGLAEENISNVQQSLEQAAAAYGQGDYETSVRLYEQLIKEGVYNGYIFYNLGNAYYRSQEKGKAVAAYLAARQLLPRHPETLANLRYVHEQGIDKLATRFSSSWWSTLFFWEETSTPKELLYAAALIWALALLGLSAYVFLRYSPLKILSFSLLACSLLIFSAFLISWSQSNWWGAITKETVQVRSGPGEHNTAVFVLHEGAPFKVVRSEDAWYKVALSDGKIGWVAHDESLAFDFSSGPP